MDYKVLFAGLGIVIGFISYASYFKGIFQGKTKPHVFSWLVWAVINWTAFFAQFVSKGGAGAWVTATSATLCTAVAIIASFRGEKKYYQKRLVQLYRGDGRNSCLDFK